MITENAAMGNWNEWSFTPSPDAVKVFNETLGKLTGVKYGLIACREQPAAGTNFKFICSAAAAVSPEKMYLAEAHLYQPPNGAPRIIHVSEIGPEPDHEPDDWQNCHFQVSEQVIGTLQETMVDFASPKLSGTAPHVADGAHYRLISRQATGIPRTQRYTSSVYLYQRASG